jgi:hypothetical protein
MIQYNDKLYKKVSGAGKAGITIGIISIITGISIGIISIIFGSKLINVRNQLID